MLSVSNLSKKYITGKIEYDVLKNISFDIKNGEFVGVMGPSGSGKTTLLNTIANFIPYNSGEILLDNRKLDASNEDGMAKIRNESLGFVFQDFMLLDGITVFENICIPLIIQRKPVKAMEKKAIELLNLFDILSIKDKYPAEISGGQKQRTAVARAMMNNPELVLADEPTGNLDSHAGQTVIDAFLEAKNNLGATIFMVTHDVYAVSFCDRVLILKDGKIYKEMLCGNSRNEFMDSLFNESKIAGGAKNNDIK